MEGLSAFQYSLIYNAFSFTVATMGAATIFFWLGRSQVGGVYKTALTITGLVTAIAAYHYFRILESWDAAYSIQDGVVTLTGQPFNDAYRYVDWLLTVPLLLVELIIVMRLPRNETINRSVRLGGLAALMIVLGYPGEVAESNAVRGLWWVLSMIPFLWILYELFVGLGEAIKRQPENARGLVSLARWVTVVAWCFYPVVFLAPLVGLTGPAAETVIQVGYTLADVVAKAAFGVLIYLIAVRKSEAEYGSPAEVQGIPQQARTEAEAAE